MIAGLAAKLEAGPSLRLKMTKSLSVMTKFLGGGNPEKRVLRLRLRMTKLLGG